MLKLVDSVWYGTEASFYQALAAEQAIAARLQAGPFDEEVKDDYLLSKQGRIGVISIRGPLVNADSPILAFFGVTGYPAIRRAVVSAAKDPSIEKILLSVDSGGGAVNGVADTADLLRRVAKIKPMHTMADGTMASAALWLGISAGKGRVQASKTSIVGSIGVLNIHVDRTKQLEDQGVKVTVLRAGKYKALLNPFEKPTEAALAQEQEKLDAVYKLFVQHVADSRGVSFADADRRMAQGREFLGAAAVDAGVIDSLATIDEVFSKLSAAPGVDRTRAVYDNVMQGDSMKPKQQATLTEQDLAALASGATSLEQQADETVSGAGVVAPAAEQPAATAAAPAEQPAAAAAAPAEQPAAPAKPEGEVVQFLRAQLAEKEEKFVAQAIELNAAKDKLATVETTQEGLLAVTRTSIARLRVALGGSAGDAETMDAASALVEHKRLSEEFQKKFKVGGVASVAPAAKDTQATHAAPALHKQRVAATKIR